MEYYAFKNRRNGKYISGTDFSVFPHRQILATPYRTPKLMGSMLEVEGEIAHRGINLATYKVVKVELKEVTL